MCPRSALTALLGTLLLSLAGSAQQTWSEDTRCPPDQPFSFCTVARGPWSMACFSEDWGSLALASRRAIEVLELGTGRVVTSIAPPTPGMSFTGIPALSPDGSLVACATSDEHVLVWDAETGAAVGLPLPASAGACIAFSHDGSLLATQGAPGEVIVWRTDTGAPLMSLSELQPLGPVCALGFDDQDAHLFGWARTAAGATQVTGVWDLTTRSLVRVFPGTAGPLGNGSIYALEPEY